MKQWSRIEPLHISRNIKESGCAISAFDKESSRKSPVLNKKGFLTVEAAIFLPLFIAGVLTFAYLIKFIAVQESVFHTFTDEARILSSEAGKNPATVPFFEPRLKERLYGENGNNIQSLDVDSFLYLYHTKGMSDMISMDLNYDINIKMPIPFYESLPVSESLIIRGFVGKEERLDPLAFKDMEHEKISQLVWIFPRAGGRYHGPDCIYIISEPKQLVMSQEIKRKYDSCSICNSKNLPNGCLVYVFRTGESYHTGDCPIVEKYVISIEKEEAEKKGYTVCLKCGGR